MQMSVPALKGRLIDQVLVLMERLGTSIRIETAQEVVKTVSEFSPWFLIAGGFNITDRELVKADLHIAQKEWGPLYREEGRADSGRTPTVHKFICLLLC